MRLRAGLAVGAVAATGIGTWWLWRHAVSLRRATRARPTGDALAVFGCSVLDDGPSGELRARLDHAVSLWRDGAAPVVVVTGGVDRGIDEVVVMREYLRESGVPAEAIIDGRPGHNTRASVTALAALDCGQYVAVSSAYHSRRIESECARQGVAVTMSAPVTTPETQFLRAHLVRFLTDALGTAWYAVPTTVTDRIDVSLIRHSVPQLLTGRPRAPRGPDASDRAGTSGAGPPTSGSVVGRTMMG